MCKYFAGAIRKRTAKALRKAQSLQLALLEERSETLFIHENPLCYFRTFQRIPRTTNLVAEYELSN